MDLKEVRYTFSKLVTIFDSLIYLQSIEDPSNDVIEEIENENGKMMAQMMKLESMK